MLNKMKSASGGNKFKGFTLVELLVVIAVIGILSAVVVLNTQSAKTKAYFANAKTALNSVQKVAISCYDGNEFLRSTTVTANTTPLLSVCVTTSGGTTASTVEPTLWIAPETGSKFTYSVPDVAAASWKILASDGTNKFQCDASACKVLP